MTFSPAKRENVHIMAAFCGASGSGKTYSAMQFASGLAGGKRFAVADSEARRALHYADMFAFDHLELKPPFRPDTYLNAAKQAVAAGYNVLVIDSMSHEHAGEGGLLDWHEELLDKFAGDDWKKREANNMRAWIEPKMSHKAMVQGFLQLGINIVFCFRAEQKVEMAKENGKTVIREKVSPVGVDGWMPVCEKNLPYEMTVSFLLRAEHPGCPVPIKLQEQHRAMFPLDKPIGREAGEAMARWASGATVSNLDKVLAAMLAAKTLDQLAGAAEQAKALGEADKPKAKEAYKTMHGNLSK